MPSITEIERDEVSVNLTVLAKLPINTRRHESSGTPGKPGQLKVVSGTRRDR